MSNSFYFHHGWRFRAADAFPLKDAVDKCRDLNGRAPTDRDYHDRDWEKVTLPHTFNGSDLFSRPIEDAGSAQKRTCAFYRNDLDVPPEHRSGRVLMTFEGVRQTCYVYVNGAPAGYHETGVGPFGFDLTPFLDVSGHNVIAVATDNTCTRNIPFCIAETPNLPGAEPGAFLLSQDEKVLAEQEGVGFFWNCNDFNPTLGGLTQPVRIFFKNDVHLTLPLYANLKSAGTYVWADGFDIPGRSAVIHVDAEVRNLSAKAAECRVSARLIAPDGGTAAAFESETVCVPTRFGWRAPMTLVPDDAYRWEDGRAVPRGEDEVRPTETDPEGVSVIRLSRPVRGLVFWEPACPALYRLEMALEKDGAVVDTCEIVTGFRKVGYDPDRGVLINDRPVWLRGYAQRASNEWAQSGIVPEWLHDADAQWIRESGANHIRWMHVAACPMDLRAGDRQGLVYTQPAGDKERETFGRQWDQRVELMRDVIIAGRNHPSILFWEAGNNVISAAHMREMRLLKEKLDPHGGRFMGCRTINTEDALLESEYVGTMLDRHAARFLALHGPVTETEYSREEAPRRVWDDFTPPDFDYRDRYLGKGGRKQKGLDFYDLTSEDLALHNASGCSEFFFDRIGGASRKDYYSACAALCWTDSAQHGRQSFSENGRMSGRVDAVRVKKQSFDLFRVMHSVTPRVKILGHWNYPPEGNGNYRARKKIFNGLWWEETDEIEKRDPKHKTVYCAGSYAVEKVTLFINGREAGVCDRPERGFIFAFPGIDITESGCIEAVGYGYDGAEECRDRIETAGRAVRLKAEMRTAPGGWRADGNDLCYVDLQVVDDRGNICPLDDRRIDVTARGDVKILGGYNSGRFDGSGRADSVSGKPTVYAECGVNRVLLRAGLTPGNVEVTFTAEGLPPVSVGAALVPADISVLSSQPPAVLMPQRLPPREEDFFTPIPKADAVKYVPDKENWCKIMVNGQEPDFRGVRAVNKNGCVWGNVLCILERMKQQAPSLLDFSFDPSSGQLTVSSRGHTITAAVGETFLTVDGVPSLMDGQPIVTPEGILVMEVSAVASQVSGASVRYDDRIGALRITI
ncbi:MAG: hypothetical protein IJR97_02575 [Clostridia bacterium]|nr:hypothetical protein [Clostridia bacterium]